MALVLENYLTVFDGLTDMKKFPKNKLLFTFRQNLEARVDTPVLDAGTDLWRQTWLDSRSMCLYGGKNDEGYRRFKIDHEFDVSELSGKAINNDGSISTTQEIYNSSTGVEFVILGKDKLEDAQTDFYAVTSTHYETIKDQLKSGKVKVDVNFSKLGTRLTKEEVPNNKLWQVLALKSNDASEANLRESSSFLKDKYVPKAEEYGCFGSDGQGLGAYVRTDVDDFRLWPFFVCDIDDWSDANGRNYFIISGRLLRVRRQVRSAGKNLGGFEYTRKGVLDYVRQNLPTDRNLGRQLLSILSRTYVSTD